MSTMMTAPPSPPDHDQPRSDTPSHSGTTVTPRRFAMISPRHKADPDWQWVSQIGPMRGHDFMRISIRNTFKPLPKLTRLYRNWQYRKAMRTASNAELLFLFSDDVGAAMTSLRAKQIAPGKRMYVGFTQDGPWSHERIEWFARTLQACDAVTMFTEEERAVYLDRYGLEAHRAHVIPISTDETDGYGKYPNESPREKPYVLSLGSPNRRFMSIARICRDLGVDLVVITRPWHRNDSLDELAGLGAEIITDAGKMKALTYLKHARVAAAAFDDSTIPGGFTTLVHAMFLQTPFVLTQCLGMGEHVVDGETGFVTPHGDEGALRDAIERLWNDDELRERFGRAALKRGESRHSLEAVAGAFHELALRVLART